MQSLRKEFSFLGGFDNTALRWLRKDGKKAFDRLYATLTYRVVELPTILRGGPNLAKQMCVEGSLPICGLPLDLEDYQSGNYTCTSNGNPIEYWKGCDLLFKSLYAKYTKEEVIRAVIWIMEFRELTCRTKGVRGSVMIS